MDTTIPACLQASPMAWVAADGTVTDLFEQPVVFRAHLVRRLHEGEIGVVRHHRLREGGELHALATEGDDLPADLVHGAFAAVEHRAQLDGGGLMTVMANIPWWVVFGGGSDLAQSRPSPPRLGTAGGALIPRPSSPHLAGLATA